MIVGTEEDLRQTGYGFAKLENSKLRFRLDDPLAPRVRVSFQITDATQICFLVRFLADLGIEYGPFSGAMLWVTDTVTPSDGPRSIALQGIELQRRAFAELRPVAVAPVHYFEAHEYEASLSMLVLAIVGDLHGYYYPNWGSPNYFLRFSGGSYIEIVSYDNDLISDTIAELDNLRWVKYGIPVV